MKMMKLIDRLNCLIGNHKYCVNDTNVVVVDTDVYRIEQKCCVCGKPVCHLIHLTTMDAYEEER